MKRAVVEEIKSRLPLLDLVMGYISVEPSGKNYKAKCPFHTEKTASFYISLERESYYCFGCGKKGDIFSFVQEYEGIDFKTALVTLAQKAGVSLDETSFQSTTDKKKEHYELLEDAAVFFEKQLIISHSAQEYILSRGLNKSTLKKFRIGYAPKDWKELSSYLLKKGYTEKSLEENGLSKKGNYGLYDRFRNRIIFPFTDASNRVIGFSGRVIEESEKEAKYINSPESPLFTKGSVLFGLSQAKEAIRTKKKVVIVEGQMDVCLVHQSGVHFVVGTSGTAFSGSLQNQSFTSSHLGIIKRFTDALYFAFDNDKAGIKAMYKATLESIVVGFKPYCISIPDGKDPADYIYSGKSFLDIIPTALPAILYFSSLLMNLNDQKILRKGIREKVWPLVVALKSSIEESYFLTLISNMTHISEQVLIDDYKSFVKSLSGKENFQNTEEYNGIQEMFVSLFSLVFYLELYHKDLFEDLKKKVLNITEDSHFFEKYYKLHQKVKEELLFKFEKTISKEHLIEKDIVFILHQFEKEFLEQKLQNLKTMIKNGLTHNDKEILEEIVVITKKLKKYEKSV